MPSMADITVKKNDGTTNVVYTALVPSAGDKSAAFWRQTAASGIPSAGPSLSVSSKSSVNGKVRIVTIDGSYPITSTNSTTGLTTVVDQDKFHAEFQLKSEFAQANHDEHVAQMVNLLASTLLQAAIKSGFAPT